MVPNTQSLGVDGQLDGLSDNFSQSFDRLHELAIDRAHVGSDFGGTEYHTGLRILLDALDEDFQLTAIGKWFAVDTIISVLAARLSTETGWKNNPQYKDVRIAKPLVIAGLPRTGTTALHKLLALDPQFQGLDLWISQFPAVRPPKTTWETNKHFRQAAEILAFRKRHMPQFYATHETSIDTPDECIEVLRQSFVSNAYTTFGNSRYQSWWWRQDELTSYRRYADVLRLIGMEQPNKTWLLKSPGQHVWALDCLFAVFPNACVVMTHRDPGKFIPSVCSLSTSRQRLFQGDSFLPGSKGVPEALKWRQALDHSTQARKTNAAQILDIRHKDFVRDQIATIRSIYDKFDLRFDPQVETTMREWLKNQPAEHKAGSHQYTAEEYGLNEEHLRELFSDYIKQFDLV